MSSARARGFTLIELLVSIVIIGIVLSIAVLSLNLAGDDRDVRKEAQRLMSILETAQDDSILQGREFGVEFLLSSYRFTEFDPQSGQWFEIRNDDLYRTRELPEDYEISLLLEDKRVLLEQDGIVLGVDDEEDANNNTDDANAALRNYAPHVLIFSSGDMTPFELHIERLTDKLSVAMQGDLLGNLEFVTDEDQRF